MKKITLQTQAKPNVRARLLDAADRLFYTEGIHAVGIDRVLEEASAAKASLYSHFGCKDDLIAAYLQRRIELARDSIEQYVEQFPLPQRILRVFECAISWSEQQQFRGCPIQLLNSEFACEQHPARQLAASQRAWMLRQFVQWCEYASVCSSHQTASTLLMLFDGALMASALDGSVRLHEAMQSAAQLLKANGASDLSTGWLSQAQSQSNAEGKQHEQSSDVTATGGL